MLVRLATVSSLFAVAVMSLGANSLALGDCYQGCCSSVRCAPTYVNPARYVRVVRTVPVVTRVYRAVPVYRQAVCRTPVYQQPVYQTPSYGYAQAAQPVSQSWGAASYPQYGSVPSATHSVGYPNYAGASSYASPSVPGSSMPGSSISSQSYAGPSASSFGSSMPSSAGMSSPAPAASSGSSCST